MASPVSIDIQLAARQVKLPTEGVRATVELLDDGITVYLQYNEVGDGKEVIQSHLEPPHLIARSPLIISIVLITMYQVLRVAQPMLGNTLHPFSEMRV